MAANAGRNIKYWLGWGLVTVALAGTLGWILLQGDDKQFLMPGSLSDGHHQLVDRCDVCHTEQFGGGEVLQQACVDCHGEDRVKPFDSHPRTKFKDPRNADRLEKIDALHCVTCHTEHKPEITLKNGLTQPKDLCFNCHEDIAEDRPSHAGMEFNTCTNSGCHNFHNNRSIYTDFLLKHKDQPALKSRAKVSAKEFADVLDEIMEYPRDDYPVESLAVEQADAPQEHLVDESIVAEWHSSGHAGSGVNCSACHRPRDSKGVKLPWQDNPGLSACTSCHALEADRFGKGKHGMRIAAGLTPMMPGKARLPMKEKVAHKQLTCESCHAAHQYNVKQAAVEACLGCHDDKHSKAYRASPHYALWQAEQAKAADANTGVSCATCHMPRIDFDVNDWMSRKLVDHNQSANFSPNSKMIRSACLHCHGLGFSIDALADEALIKNNFNGKPSVHVESINLAIRDQERYLKELEKPEE